MNERHVPTVPSSPRVRALRIAARLSQSDLAALMGYTPGYVANVERGIQPPTARFLARLGRALRPTVITAWRRSKLARPGQLDGLAMVLADDPEAIAGALVAGCVQVCHVAGCGRRFVSNHPRRRKCYICSPIRVRKEGP